jgi:DNA-binding NarL/FixJ family response regulator
MPFNRARILIADDHNLVAELCKTLLEPEFDVIGTVSDGHALLRAAIELKPVVIVLDIAMPVLNGLDAGKQVKEALHAVKLIYLTMNTDPELAVEAFHRGASGYLPKTCAASELVLAVRDVLRGRTYLSPTLKERVNYLRWEQKEIRDGANRLTERQREVLQLL